MMPALKIERCEQFYTDTDARSAQTYLYGAVSHQPPTQERPRTLADVIGWCLSNVRLQSPAFGALVLVTDPEDPRPPLRWRGRETSEKGDALMTVEHGSPLIEEYHRRAAEARRLADTHGVSPDERDDLLEVERRWSSLIILGNPAAILRKTERETP